MFSFQDLNLYGEAVKKTPSKVILRVPTDEPARPNRDLSKYTVNEKSIPKIPSPKRKIRSEDVNIRQRVNPESVQGRLSDAMKTTYNSEIENEARKLAMIGEKVITKLFKIEVPDRDDIDYINRRSKLLAQGMSKEDADKFLKENFREQFKAKVPVDITRMNFIPSVMIDIVKQFLQNTSPQTVQEAAITKTSLNNTLLRKDLTIDSMVNVIDILKKNPELRTTLTLNSPLRPLAVLSNFVVGANIDEINLTPQEMPVSDELDKQLVDGDLLDELLGEIESVASEVVDVIEEEKKKDDNVESVEDYVATASADIPEVPLEEEEPDEDTPDDKFKDEVIDILENSQNVEGDLNRVLNNPLFAGFNSLKFKQLINDAIDGMGISDDEKILFKNKLMTIVSAKFRVPEEEFKPPVAKFREEVITELIEAGTTANYKTIKERYKDRLTEDNMDTIIEYERKKIYETPTKPKIPSQVALPETPAETPMTTPAGTRPATPIPEEELPQELPQTNEALIKQIENLPDTIIINDLKQIIARFNAMVEPSGARFKFQGTQKIKALDKQKHIDNLKRKLETWQNEKGKIQRPFLVLKDTLEPIKECFIQQFAQLKRSTKESNISIVNKYVFDESLTIAKLLQNIDTLRMSLSWPNTQTGLSDYAYSKTLRCIIGKIIDSLKNAGTLQKEEASIITAKKEKIWMNKDTTQKEKIDEFKRLIENEFQSKAPIIKSDEPSARPAPVVSTGTASTPATIQTISTPSKTGQGMKKRGRPPKPKKSKQKREASKWIIEVQTIAKDKGLKYSDALKEASKMRKMKCIENCL